MNFFQILSEIEKVDPEVYDRLDSRRSVFKHMSGLGQKLTAAAVPLAVGAIFNKAYGQTPSGLSAVNVLNFALKLEYLEKYFYQQRPTSLFSSTNQAGLALIATDEANHVTFLTTVINSVASGQAFPDPTVAAFDYTAGGAFPTALTSAGTYLALAQSFEDTGVRAYKGAAPLTSVMANKTVLTAALNIHSVEARHASHIRSMRRAGSPSTQTAPSQGVAASPYDSAPKSWVSGTDNGGAAAPTTAGIYGVGVDTGTATYGASNQTGPAAGVYFRAEGNVIQGDNASSAGVTLSTSTSSTFAGFPSAAFSEAFDEGLDVTTVTNIAKLFVRSGYTVF
jgi:hypothetical protein